MRADKLSRPYSRGQKADVDPPAVPTRITVSRAGTAEEVGKRRADRRGILRWMSSLGVKVTDETWRNSRRPFRESPCLVQNRSKWLVLKLLGESPGRFLTPSSTVLCVSPCYNFWPGGLAALDAGGGTVPRPLLQRGAAVRTGCGRRLRSLRSVRRHVIAPFCKSWSACPSIQTVCIRTPQHS